MMTRIASLSVTAGICLTALLPFASCSPAPEAQRQQALDFLYASMPLPDSVDYPREFWLQNVDCALQTRREMPWGRTIPDREWRHFVLPVRVNNENLDSARWVFYRELKPRIEHLSMADAILEVNHWCHEQVTYHPSDERTSSPLATVRTALGRCGEESTFLVAALRSVGIPARQVYTPRWAHTDDNHAWVEAWADGTWHFLGACEPEAVLDLGWFNAPASRGMLMHTKVFGNYDGPEEVMQRNACYTEIDVTANYAPVSRAYVQVVDTLGNAMTDATVKFKIYNYAEFYTVATKAVDAHGIASLQAGLGDLFVWAYRHPEGEPAQYGYAVCRVKESPDTLQVALSHQAGDRISFDADVTPPVERNTLPALTEEQRLTNQQRLAREDSLRNAYVATFVQEGDPLLIASRGNHAVILNFLDEANDRERAESLLRVISEKDLRDVTPAVLQDSYGHTPACPDATADDFCKYLLSPRILNEQLTPYKAFFQQEVPDSLRQQFQADINSLISWTRQNITLDEVSNPQHLRMTPIGAWRCRRCDAVSRDIFFVALARSMGHLAYINRVNGQVLCRNHPSDAWLPVNFASRPAEGDTVATRPLSNELALSLTYSPTSLLPDPKYYIHFTLSRLTDDGSLKLLEYGEDDTYRSLFSQPHPLDSGDYLLVTGTRLASGKVLAHGEMFPLRGNTPKEPCIVHREPCINNIPLLLRQATEGLQVIGNFNSEDLYLDASLGQSKSLLSTTGRGYYILGIIAPNNEPTSHALRDLSLRRTDIEQWGGKVMLLFRDEAERARFRPGDYPELPANVVFGSDIDDVMLSELCQNLHLTDRPRQATLPLFIIADTFNRIVWYRQGYTIGLGDQLVTALSQTK